MKVRNYIIFIILFISLITNGYFYFRDKQLRTDFSNIKKKNSQLQGIIDKKTEQNRQVQAISEVLEIIADFSKNNNIPDQDSITEINKKTEDVADKDVKKQEKAFLENPNKNTLSDFIKTLSQAIAYEIKEQE